MFGLRESREREGDLFKLEWKAEVAALKSLIWILDWQRLFLDRLIKFDKIRSVRIKILWYQI